MSASAPGIQVEHTVVSGVFTLDGRSFDVDNNVWLLGNETDVLVIDAPHDASAIADAVHGRQVRAIVCTHGHNDHVNAALELAERTGARVLLHPEDLDLWHQVHPGQEPDGFLGEGEHLEVAGVDLAVLHTPGHSPGSVCLYCPELATVFSGDTLFQGGPGATGQSFSSFDAIITSIRDQLLTLPPATLVRTGHGPTTTIGDEAPHLDEWIARGH